MAESWTYSRDCLELTFKLRRDVKWHDGRPFTADDVLFTYQTMINPKTPAGRIGRSRYDKLADAIRTILEEAIVQGGSTLRDFLAVNGQSGYFQQTYFVYDRAGVPCRNCGAPIRQIKQGQRSTFYCVNCQK